MGGALGPVGTLLSLLSEEASELVTRVVGVPIGYPLSLEVVDLIGNRLEMVEPLGPDGSGSGLGYGSSYDGGGTTTVEVDVTVYEDLGTVRVLVDTHSSELVVPSS